MVYSKHNFDSHSTKELREILCQLLPSLEKLIPVAREFCRKNTSMAESSPCDSCSNKASCLEPCDDLKAMLPKINGGRGRRENLTGLYPDTLQQVEKIRLSEVFKQYEACKGVFTKKQWIVIYLYFKEGKTERQIADELGKSRSTISDLLNRAKRKKGIHDNKSLVQNLELLKKNLKNQTK